jgi:hypothetical protein
MTRRTIKTYNGYLVRHPRSGLHYKAIPPYPYGRCFPLHRD